MAFTQLTLLFIGVLAAGLGFFGIFYNFDDSDDWTPVLLQLISAVLWGMFGLGAFSIRVPDGTSSTDVVTIFPLVLVGMAFAIIIALYALYHAAEAFRKAADDVDPRALGK